MKSRSGQIERCLAIYSMNLDRVTYRSWYYVSYFKVPIHFSQTSIKNDLRGLEISWERADELAMDRVKWRRCVARCSVLHRITKV